MTQRLNFYSVAPKAIEPLMAVSANLEAAGI
jgi:hypothetical protein